MRITNSFFGSQALAYGATAGEGMEYMSSYRRHSRRLGKDQGKDKTSSIDVPWMLGVGEGQKHLV